MSNETFIYTRTGIWTNIRNTKIYPKYMELVCILLCICQRSEIQKCETLQHNTNREHTPSHSQAEEDEMKIWITVIRTAEQCWALGIDNIQFKI